MTAFLGKQNRAEANYTRGRHNNCDTIYISQNYFRLPRQTILEDAHIYADHCDDIPKEEFNKRF